MIEYVTLTGEIEKGQIGCSNQGRHFFARPVFLTVFQSIPSQGWLDKYKKHFFGVVTYENQINSSNQYDRPLFLGVTPVNNEHYQGVNIENKHKIQTEKFTVTLDDEGNNLNIVSDTVEISIDANKGLINIKNGNTSIRQIFTDILKTYIKTKTIDQKPLSPDSISDAIDNLTEIKKLFE